jgi:hypothetical protein
MSRVLKNEKDTIWGHSYQEWLEGLKHPSRAQDRTVILNTHGGEGLGIAGPEGGSWIKRTGAGPKDWSMRGGPSVKPTHWDVASVPRFLRDLPEHYDLALLSMCNPGAVLQRGDISVEMAQSRMRKFGFAAPGRTVTIHNSKETLHFESGKLVKRVPYNAPARKSPLAQVMVPNRNGIAYASWHNETRAGIDLLALSGSYSLKGSSQIVASRLTPTAKEVKQGMQTLRWAEEEIARKPATVAANALAKAAAKTHVPVKGTGNPVGGILALLGLGGAGAGVVGVRRRRRGQSESAEHAPIFQATEPVGQISGTVVNSAEEVFGQEVAQAEKHFGMVRISEIENRAVRTGVPVGNGTTAHTPRRGKMLSANYQVQALKSGPMGAFVGLHQIENRIPRPPHRVQLGDPNWMPKVGNSRVGGSHAPFTLPEWAKPTEPLHLDWSPKKPTGFVKVSDVLPQSPLRTHVFQGVEPIGTAASELTAHHQGWSQLIQDGERLTEQFNELKTLTPPKPVSTKPTVGRSYGFVGLSQVGHVSSLEDELFHAAKNKTPIPIGKRDRLYFQYRQLADRMGIAAIVQEAKDGSWSIHVDASAGDRLTPHWSRVRDRNRAQSKSTSGTVQVSEVLPQSPLKAHALPNSPAVEAQAKQNAAPVTRSVAQAAVPNPAPAVTRVTETKAEKATSTQTTPQKNQGKAVREPAAPRAAGGTIPIQTPSVAEAAVKAAEENLEHKFNPRRMRSALVLGGVIFGAFAVGGKLLDGSGDDQPKPRAHPHPAPHSGQPDAHAQSHTVQSVQGGTPTIQHQVNIHDAPFDMGQVDEMFSNHLAYGHAFNS